MSKNLLQDVIKIKRIKREEAPEPIEHSSPSMHPIKEASENSSGSRYSLWFVALVSIVFLLFALSFLFAGVKVTVNPKLKDFNLNENFFAAKDSTADTLPFDLVAISGEETKTVIGGEEKDVAIAAKGVVLIYNAFSSAPQTLNIDTRLEGSNGKLYKTDRQVIVPGMAKDVPGSVEVGIHAAEPGEAYNSSPLDFKIFGFKGTPKYAKFYARSKGDIGGGLVGKFPAISDSEKAAAVSELKTALQAKLLQKATDQIPSGFILFKDAIFLDIDDAVVDFVPKATDISIHVKGTLNGFLFDEGKLTKKIAETVIEKYDGSEVYIPNIRDLSFYLANKESISFGDVKNIAFNLSGASKIVWKVDTAVLAEDMLGKQKSDFNQILSKYPNIDSADLVLRPIWKTSFPEKIKDIKVIVNYPK